jgi:hypothetical protein
MPTATFDGPNLIVQLPSVGTYDAQADIYSRWKDWVLLSDNAKYPPAFDTTGGDPTGGSNTISPSYFLRNDLGWRIKMPEASGSAIIDGNVFPRDDGTDEILPPDGAFTVVYTKILTSNATTVTVGSGVTAQDKTDIIDGVWAYER